MPVVEHRTMGRTDGGMCCPRFTPLAHLPWMSVRRQTKHASRGGWGASLSGNNSREKPRRVSGWEVDRSYTPIRVDTSCAKL